MTWLLFAAALAVPPEVAAVMDELQRAREELALPDSPAAYHLRGTITRVENTRVLAREGGLVERWTGSTASLGVEVRVGDPSYDNTGLSGVYGYLSQGFVQAELPIEADERAWRMAAWRAADTGFKDAVENYARKRAQVVLPPDHPGDFEVRPPVVADAGDARASAPDDLIDLATSLSSRCAMSEGLDSASVLIGHEAGERWIVDTDGAVIRRPILETTVVAVVRARAADGMWIEDAQRWVVGAAAELDRDELDAACEALAVRVGAIARAPAFEEEYVGPVLFEGAAAADLFRYLLGDQLLGTPPPADFETFLGSLPAGSADARLLRRVLPPGWEVVDDPQALPNHPGALRWDDEGVAAERVTLVQDGIVRALVTSRTPRKGIPTSNGHARSTPGSRAEARLTLTTVEAPRARSAKSLTRTAHAAGAAYGRDWVLVVRRLRDPSTMMWDTGVYVDPAELPLPPPVEVWRVWTDGRTELLRGAAFSQVQRHVLRDIVAAGPATSVDYLASFEIGQYPSSPLSGLPARFTAPSVVVGEVEVVPNPGDPGDAPSLPAPRKEE